MPKSFFIMTGTSRGIGEALAALLLEEGHYVCGISRGIAEALSPYENYFHINFDLSQIERIHDVMKDLLGMMREKDIDRICLINNASMLEPIKSIEACQAHEISKSLQVSLVAPIVLTSSFIRQTREFKMRKKVINISSGSGVYPAPDMSVYCTAKAGLNMFTKCVGMEQGNDASPVELVAVDPGMVETEMQRTARGLTSDEFAMADYFRAAYTGGKLLPADEAARHLRRIIDNEYEQGSIVSYLE